MKLDTWTNVYDAMLGYFQDAHDVRSWLYSAHPKLNGKSPLEVWATGPRGRDDVRMLVRQVISGGDF